MAQDNVTIEEENKGFWHRAGVFGEGIYDGGIAAIAGTVGGAVDLVNNAPRALNIIPGVEGFKPFSDRPFAGSAMIRENLTGAHDAYKDAVLPNGADTFAPVDMTDNIIYGGGYVTGIAAGTLGTGAAANGALNLAAGGGSNIKLGESFAKQFFDEAGNATMLGRGTQLAGRGTATATKLTATTALRHPFLATAGAAAADIAYNDGALSSHLGKKATDAAATRFGLSPIFGNSDTPSLLGTGAKLLQDPTKLAGMATIALVLGSLLGGRLGGPLGMIAGAAITMLFHNVIGEKSHEIADWAKEKFAGNDTPSQTVRLAAPAPGP